MIEQPKEISASILEAAEKVICDASIGSVGNEPRLLTLFEAERERALDLPGVADVRAWGRELATLSEAIGCLRTVEGHQCQGC